MLLHQPLHPKKKVKNPLTSFFMFSAKLPYICFKYRSFRRQALKTINYCFDDIPIFHYILEELKCTKGWKLDPSEVLKKFYVGGVRIRSLYQPDHVQHGQLHLPIFFRTTHPQKYLSCVRYIAKEKKLIFIPLTLFYASMKSPEIWTLLQPIMFRTIDILPCRTNPYIPYDSS